MLLLWYEWQVRADLLLSIGPLVSLEKGEWVSITYSCARQSPPFLILFHG